MKLKVSRTYTYGNERFSSNCFDIVLFVVLQLQRVPIPKVEEEKDLITLFSEYPWGDLWADADLIPVIRYVYGARRLRMPDCWKAVFPISLPDMDCESD